MPKKKYLFFPALFAAYFLIFAASPIYGTVRFTRTYGQTCNAFNLKLLIADLLTQSNKKGNDRFHSATVFFKKKRAIPSQNNFRTVRNQGEYLKTASLPYLTDQTLYNLGCQDGTQELRSVRRCHSGLSPPSV